MQQIWDAFMDCWHRFDEYLELITLNPQDQALTSNNTNNSQEGIKNQDTFTAPTNAYLAHYDQLQVPQGLELQACLSLIHFVL